METRKERLIEARNRSGSTGGVFKLSTGSGDVRLALPKPACPKQTRSPARKPEELVACRVTGSSRLGVLPRGS